MRVRRQNRLIAILLLVLFGASLIKSLNPQSFAIDDCNEFGHIHKFKMSASGPSVLKLSPSSSDKNVDCHEGKSIFSFSTLPSQIFVFAQIPYEIEFEKIPRLTNSVPSPDPETPRKPPKGATFLFPVS